MDIKAWFCTWPFEPMDYLVSKPSDAVCVNIWDILTGPQVVTASPRQHRTTSSMKESCYTDRLVAVKVCFTLKQWHTIFPGKWFSGKRLSGKMTIRETSFRESDIPGNVRKPVISSLCYQYHYYYWNRQNFLVNFGITEHNLWQAQNTGWRLNESWDQWYSSIYKHCCTCLTNGAVDVSHD